MPSSTAVVVGAGSTIGTAVAVALADAGFTLDLWGRDPARLADTIAQVRAATAGAVGWPGAAGAPVAAGTPGAAGAPAVAGAAGSLGSARPAGADGGGGAAGAGPGSPEPVARVVELTDAAAVDAAAGAVAGPVGAVVYAAGLFDWGDADAADPDAWAALVQVNLTAAMRVARRLLPALLAAAPSTLVLVGSGAARQAYPHNPAYVASKHGLLGFARATFLDVRDRGVRVSVVNPGLVAAGAGLLAGADPATLLQPGDVAAAVRYAVTAPPRACITELDLQPLRTPS